MTIDSREAEIRNHFLDQAAACEKLGSVFTARLCRALARCLDHSTQVGDCVLNWPGNALDDALSLRLCGGLHALVLAGADPALSGLYPPHEVGEESLAAGLPGILVRHQAALVQALDSAPQTNEIGRSGMLLPGFLTIARKTGLPLSLCEIGSSAGLNQLFDTFHYRYGDTDWGDASSPVRLAPEVRGAPPPLAGHPQILSRRGCDIAPVDLADPQARLRLRSYVWADQMTRLERLDAALVLAGRMEFSVERADALAFVHRQLRSRSKDSTFVLFHSIMWQYLPLQTRADIELALKEAGAEARSQAPIAWLRMEPAVTGEPHATLSLTLWPEGEPRMLAHCDYHGRWIRWLG